MKMFKYLLICVIIFANITYAQESEGFFSKVKGAVASTVSDAKGNFWLDLANKQYYEEQNYISAFKNYNYAANRDMPQAHYMIYIMQKNGQGTSKNYKNAIDSLTKASTLNYPKAHTDLAIEKLQNAKNKNDVTAAIKLLEKAAKQEELLACTHLYHFYSKGINVKKDTKKANGYARIANALGASLNVKTSYDTTDKALLKQIQGNLKLLGYYHGTIDGVYGPMTKKAITDFQKANKFKQTGQSSKELLIQTQKAL